MNSTKPLHHACFQSLSSGLRRYLRRRIAGGPDNSVSRCFVVSMESTWCVLCSYDVLSHSIIVDRRMRCDGFHARFVRDDIRVIVDICLPTDA